MRTILVTATEESTGKTAVALALALEARERDLSVGYMKPKGTRLQSVVGKTLDRDPMLARELLDLDAEMHELEPVVYSPTFVESVLRGEEDPAGVRDRIRECFEDLAADRDLMVVEGTPLATGGTLDLTDPELAALLDAEVLIVADYEGARDTDDVLQAADLVGERLEGVVFNGVPDAHQAGLHDDAVPFLESREVPVVGVVPRDRELAGVTVGELAEELGATVLTDAPTDAYVERFLVGAMGPEASLRHFRRSTDVAVITGGDRSEIHTAALEAPGVRCLLLTGGFQPSGAVVGRAEERGVPILTVSTDTAAAVERAEAVVHGGRTQSRETVERMRGLLADHADLDRVL